MDDRAQSAGRYLRHYADGPPSSLDLAHSGRRVLVLAEAGTYLTECLWAAEAIATRCLARAHISFAVHSRLVHDGAIGTGFALARGLCAKRTDLLVWVDKPYSLAFESMGYSAVVVLEPNQIFRTVPFVSKHELDDGDPDFEPTALERALLQVKVPVIRMWDGPEWAKPHGPRTQVVVNDYNRGRNALVRVLGERYASLEYRLRETSEYLARLVVGLVLDDPDQLDEDEISGWLAQAHVLRKNPLKSTGR